MSLRRILGASLCLNVVFIAVSLFEHRAGPSSVRSIHSLSVTAKNESSARGAHPADELPSGSQTVPPLLWSALYNDELSTYVANLRGAGFPEPIVQNIIVKELDRLFSSRARPASLDTNFWRTGPQRDRDEMEHRQAERSLESEKRTKIKELLGVEWHETSGARKDEAIMFMSSLAGNVDVEKAERLASLWEKINDRSTELKSTYRLKTPELETGRRQAYEEALAEFREALGPAGFEELELRAMATDVTDVWGSERLFGCVMTGREFREFLRIRKDATLPLASLFDLDVPEPSPEVARDVEGRLRSLLGEERFQGYERAKDPQFRWIRGATGRNENMELAWAVYDIYAGLREASSQVRDQAVPAEESLETTLRNLRASTEKQLEKTMGPEKFAAYVGAGKFAWLDELTVKEAKQK